MGRQQRTEFNEAPATLSSRYRCWHRRLSQHKSLELQVSRWPDAKMFDVEFCWRRRRDHAGVEFCLTAFWREFRTAYYDHRHWDAERGTFSASPSDGPSVENPNP